MKNIVILQLESVSMVNYRMHPELFPNVRKVESESIRYSNYYATATSTAMVINDITHSDIYRLENTAIYGEFKVTHPDVDSFVDFFSGGVEAGHAHSLGVHYPHAHGNELNPAHMYAKNTDVINYDDYASALSDVRDTIRGAKLSNAPFLVYFLNECSHLSYGDEKKFTIADMTQRWYYGYRKLDDTIGDFFRILREENVLKNTVVVIYGDHGNDFYGHDYNGGYAHGIEPYADIVHTPLIIYDADTGSCDVDDIVCSLDIRQIALNLAGMDTKQENPYIYDKMHSNRKYVFSRNLFAAQKPQQIQGYIRNVRKSYGITNETYSLILTDEGWRMYLHQIDPSCNGNFLEFFTLEDGQLHHIGGLADRFEHYVYTVGFGSMEQIAKSFSEMSEYMRQELDALARETGLDDIMSRDCMNKIFYQRDMTAEFAKISAQREERCRYLAEKNKEHT
jgi:hypothetical protein